MRLLIRVSGLLAVIALCGIWIVAQSPPGQKELEMGKSYQGKGDKTTAKSYYAQAAALGNHEAEYKLAVLLSDEWDIGGAHEYYRRSAEGGYAAAQSYLAFAYFNGFVVPKNYAEGGKWANLAAKQGDAYAMFLIGDAYEQGIGVTADPTQAVQSLRKAATKGERRAKDRLCRDEILGPFLPRDPVDAVKWCRQADAEGSSAATNNLGGAYENGLGGLPRNLGEAKRLYRKAAQNGNAKAQANLDRLEPPPRVACSGDICRCWMFWSMCCASR